MGRARAGMLATSKAGHDKNKLYVIIRVDESYVYLVDGSSRTIEYPKKKKEKHIQLICREMALTDITNEDIRRNLEVFVKEMRGE